MECYTGIRAIDYYKNRKGSIVNKNKRGGRNKAPRKKKTGITYRGTLSKTKKGFGFLISPDTEQDIFISSHAMKDAMDGDTVEVELIPQIHWKSSPEGVVTRIVKRNRTEIVGTFSGTRKFGFVEPDDRRLKEDVFIMKKNFAGAQKGDKVVATIIKYPKGRESAEGKITQIISRSGEAGGDIKAMIRMYGLNPKFPPKVQAESEAMHLPLRDDFVGRRDLRGKRIITVDGADSKDFDDAVSIEKTPEGHFLLGVHIADVSHYVREGSNLDKEALERGNSVYLIDQVVPMLPVILSNGICSLNPQADRLTLSCEMEIDGEGNVLNHEIFESVICSNERMVYDDVSDILEKKDPGGYENIYNDLLLMEELQNILEAKRAASGSIDFDLDEANITLNSEGIPVSIDIAQRRIANKIIEEFMLAANRTVAEHFAQKNAPFVYRVHDKPAADKMGELSVFLKGFGITLSADPADVHPGEIKKILDDVAGKEYENVVNKVILRSMQKAVYDTECKGHFGLAMKYYCHFTSPIRRYPDLIIHRIIKEYLKGGPDSKKEKNFRRKTRIAAEVSSETERKAVELEREVEKLKMAEYMSYHVGERYEGIISGVTNFGVFVQLENTAEGLIRMEDLADDYYDYDPKRYRLVGRSKGKIYALGDKASIEVSGVDIEAREVEFRPV